MPDLTKTSVSSQLPSTGDLIHFTTSEGLKPDGITPAEFSGRLGQRLILHPEKRREAWVGLGPESNLTANSIRAEAGATARALVRTGSETLVLQIQNFAPFAGAAVEGVLLALFRFEDLLPPEKKSTHQLRKLVVVVAKEDLKSTRNAVHNAAILAESTNLTRRIGDTPPNLLTPATLAEEAKTAAAAWGLKCRIWTESTLTRDGFGGILAVGQGSANPPRLIRLDYACGKKNVPTLAVIGKAITFDTGGISIKGRAGMAEMKWDKMGGCAALGIAVAVARLKLPLNLTVLIPSAENMPDGNSFRPGDIITQYGGRTTEILDTDAEGRLVLGDAIAYAAAKIKPDAAVTLATLTGACIVALGTERAGLFTHNPEWAKTLHELGESTGDRVWHLPHDDEFAKAMESKVAAIKNLGSREGGACSAASFLNFFAGSMPLIHLDIAGPAQITTPQPFLQEGASGFGVRLVSRFAEHFGT